MAGPSEQHIDISICIANYNGDAVLINCMQSIFYQKHNYTLEVIVHDDASNDNSLQQVQDYASTQNNIRIITSENNLGYCRSNNRMADIARGEYLLFLNNDAELLPDAINSLMKLAEAHDFGVGTLPQYQFDTGEIFDRGMLLDIFANPIPNTDINKREVTTVMGSLLFIRRDLWEQIGGFPEWFDSIGEDLYLCQYVRVLGRKVLVSKHSGYRHHIGHSFGGGKVIRNRLSTSLTRRKLSERNKTYVLLLFYPLPVLMLILPLHYLLLILEGIALSIAKWDISILSEIYFSTIIAASRSKHRIIKHRQLFGRDRNINLFRFNRGLILVPYKLCLLAKFGLPELVE